MPIYEYRCKECHQLFEEWSKHVEDHNVQHACPICKGQAERLVSNTSFALKGGGWYVTEYGSRKGLDGNSAQKSEGTSCSCPSGSCVAEAAPTPASS